jgi:hypothetical protein
MWDMRPPHGVSGYPLVPGKSAYLLSISLLQVFHSWAWNLPRKLSFHRFSNFLRGHSKNSLFALPIHSNSSAGKRVFFWVAFIIGHILMPLTRIFVIYAASIL